MSFHDVQAEESGSQGRINALSSKLSNMHVGLNSDKQVRWCWERSWPPPLAGTVAPAASFSTAISPHLPLTFPVPHLR